MAKKKKNVGRPANPTKTVPFSVRIPEEVREAFQSYCDSYPHRIHVGDAVADALKLFLEQHGFWPPQSEPEGNQ